MTGTAFAILAMFSNLCVVFLLQYFFQFGCCAVVTNQCSCIFFQCGSCVVVTIFVVFVFFPMWVLCCCYKPQRREHEIALSWSRSQSSARRRGHHINNIKQKDEIKTRCWHAMNNIKPKENHEFTLLSTF